MKTHHTNKSEPKVLYVPNITTKLDNDTCNVSYLIYIYIVL